VDQLLLIVVGCLVSYLIGSLPFGLWTGLLWKGVDIHTLGSKNIGATNVLRVLGLGPGLTVFVLDTLKGGAGIWLTQGYAAAHGDPLPFRWLVLFGLVAVLGHTFSPFLRFRGGKGVATTLGVLFALAWQVGVVGFSVFLITLGLTRYVSVGSLAAGISLPIASWVFLQGEQRIGMIVLTLVIDTLVFIKHRANIQRLIAGTEPKIGQRATAPAEESPSEVTDEPPADTEGPSHE
jgi:glycerol-3-phosphate acyltransferase PlsY